MTNMLPKGQGILAWLAIYREPAVLRMFFLGFSSGLPLLLVLGTLSFWMRESGVDLKSIGFMSWVGLCWGMKWMWAPLVDKLRIPFLTAALGQRRAWLLAAQIGLMLSLILMAFADPAKNLTFTAALALATAFFGATQDIALDAFRIESGSEGRQAAFAATYQTGYRIAMIWAGAGALAIAAAFETSESATAGWKIAYLVMAASMSVGIATVLLSPEPKRSLSRQRTIYLTKKEWLFDAICKPFLEQAFHAAEKIEIVLHGDDDVLPSVHGAGGGWGTFFLLCPERAGPCVVVLLIPVLMQKQPFRVGYAEQRFLALHEGAGVEKGKGEALPGGVVQKFHPK